MLSWSAECNLGNLAVAVLHDICSLATHAEDTRAECEDEEEAGGGNDTGPRWLSRRDDAGGSGDDAIEEERRRAEA